MIPQFKLKRIASRIDGCFGVLLDDTVPFAVTCERPWANNTPQISAIPWGTYLCKRVVSPKFGVTFEITGVPGRSAILFHKGNTIDDSRGCVLIGEAFEPWSDGRVSIAQSGKGFEEFMNRTALFDAFYLKVEDVS